MKCSVTGMTPLHYICKALPLPFASGIRDRLLIESMACNHVNQISIGDGGVIVNTNTLPDIQALSEMELMMKAGDCLRIIRTLLETGAPPNATDCLGRRPLHLLAQNASRFGAALGPVVELLVSAGARIDDNIPILHAPSPTPSPTILITEENINIFKNRDNLNIKSLLVVELSEIELIIKDALESWNSNMILDATNSHIDTHHIRNITPELKFEYSICNQSLRSNQIVKDFLNSIESESSTASNSCHLCSIGYSMFRRKYNCSTCNIECCDECSKKRLILSSTSGKGKVRSCDTCYNVIKALIVQAQKEQSLKKSLKNNSKTISGSSGGSNGSGLYIGNGNSSNGNETISTKRASLFGGSKVKTTSPTPPSASLSSDRAQTTQASLAETRNALEKRGEKLEQLSDKSGRLMEASNEFAKLAEKLKQQQKSSFFGW